MSTKGTILAPDVNAPVTFIDQPSDECDASVREHIDQPSHVLGFVFLDGSPCYVAYGETREEAVLAFKDGGADTFVERMGGAARVASADAMTAASIAVYGLDPDALRERIAAASEALEVRAQESDVVEWVFNEVSCYLADLLVLCDLEYDPWIAKAFASQIISWMDRSPAAWKDYMETHSGYHLESMKDAAEHRKATQGEKIDPKDLN